MDQRSHSRDLRLKSLYASSFGVFSFVGTEHRAVIMREEWICQFFPLIKTISYFCFRFIRVALLLRKDLKSLLWTSLFVLPMSLLLQL